MEVVLISNITIDKNFTTVFSEETYEQHTRGGMILTDQIDTLNLRFRESEPGYKTDWHIAGDPTLIIIQQGTLRITMRNGEYKDFSCGDQFIARDYLPEHLIFNETHGHRAEVLGNQTLKAVHIKLSKV